MKSARMIVISVVFLFLIIALSSVHICAESNESARGRAEENAEFYIYLQTLDNDLEIQPAETITYPITVRNLGDENITYYPPPAESLGLPTGWVITYSPATDLFIQANSHKDLAVNLTATADAKAGTMVKFLLIGSTSNQDAEIIPIELRTTVNQIFDTSFSMTDKVVFDSPTESENLEITITNNGNGDDRVKLEISNIPTGLELSQVSQEFIIVQGASKALTITLYPSSLLTAGDYGLDFSLYRISNSGKKLVSSLKLDVSVVYYPDLYISMGDIELSKYPPVNGEEIYINVTAHNIGDSDARNFKVSIIPVTRSGSQLDDIDDVMIPFLGTGNSTVVQVKWRAQPPAVNILLVKLDTDNTVGELNETNNEARLQIYIQPRDHTQEQSSDVNRFSVMQVTAIGIIAILIGGISAAFLSTEYSKFGLYRLILPFYTRVKRDEVLKHGVREEVYDYVKNHPGEHFRAILTKLGLTNGTLVHHLNTLERQNFIKSERDGPFKRFYPKGRKLTEEVLEISLPQKRILDAINDTPGITQKSLSRQLQTSPPTINYHVKALREVRLINIKRDGKNTLCFPGESTNGWYKSGEVS